MKILIIDDSKIMRNILKELVIINDKFFDAK